MKRIHTSPSSFHQTFVNYTNTYAFSSIKQRISTQHTQINTVTNQLVQALKQNRQRHQKLKGKKKTLKGLLDSSLRKFKQQRCSTPIFKNPIKVQTKQCRKSVQLKGPCPLRKQIACDMKQFEQMKKEILQNINNHPYKFVKSKETPALSRRQNQEIVEPQGKEKQVFEDSLQQTPHKPKQMQIIKEYIQSKIDTIGQLLDRVSTLMSTYKVQFRITLYLFYKLFWITRKQITSKISHINTPQDEEYQELINQNLSIEKCLASMMNKLKQSKKWKQYQTQPVFSSMSLDNQGKQKLVKVLMENLLKNYSKLKLVMQYSQDNMKILYDFGCSFFILTKQDLRAFFSGQQQRYLDFVQKPSKVDVDELWACISKISKELEQ